MAAAREALEWTFLTPLVNEVKPAQTFLHTLLFSTHVTTPTAVIEIARLIGDRSMAPFTKRGAEATMVAGLTQEAYDVRPPAMRIKKPFTPSPLLFQRGFGEAIYLNPGQTQQQAVQTHIARDTQRMVTLMENSQEYLSAQALTGTISYSNVDQGVAFEIAFARDPGNEVVLTGPDLWDAGTSEPFQDVLAAKRQVADQHGLNLTDVILGDEATDAFTLNTKIRADIKTDTALNAGAMNLAANFNGQGVVFLGMVYGLRWWSYGRSINVPGSGLTPLVRSKFAEFVAVGPASEMVEYFGAIEDMTAFQSGLLAAERYSKGWEIQDPSSIVQLVESHPLPVLRRPNAVYSLQVVA